MENSSLQKQKTIMLLIKLFDYMGEFNKLGSETAVKSKARVDSSFKIELDR